MVATSGQFKELFTCSFSSVRSDVSISHALAHAGDWKRLTESCSLSHLPLFVVAKVLEHNSHDALVYTV